MLWLVSWQILYLKVTLKGEMDDSGMVTCLPCSHYPMGPPVIWPTYVPIFIFNCNVPIKFFSKYSIPILNRAYHINTFQFATLYFRTNSQLVSFLPAPNGANYLILYYFEDTNDICIAFYSKQVGPRARATCRLVLLEDWRWLHHTRGT